MLLACWALFCGTAEPSALAAPLRVAACASNERCVVAIADELSDDDEKVMDEAEQ